jgi:hypothetical protein
VNTLFLDQRNNNCKQGKEIVSLISIGVFEEDYLSVRASSFQTFAVAKKNGSKTIIFFTDFRKNCDHLLLKCHPFLIPKIGGIIRSTEGLSFAKALDLNLGYYYIKID